jgi:uncharacterized oligopeptide transporter (OPT) family protein
MVILLDRWLQHSGHVVRVPVLAFALGLYLPFKLSAAVFVGGLLAALARKRSGGKQLREGLLCAAGLITGEALVGIVLAVPIALSSVWPSISPDPLLLFPRTPWGAWPGVVVLAAVGVWLYRKAIPRRPTGYHKKPE